MNRTEFLDEASQSMDTFLVVVIARNNRPAHDDRLACASQSPQVVQNQFVGYPGIALVPDRVYLLADRANTATPLSVDRPLYRPFLTNREGEEQVDTHSSDVWVEISPESVCHGQVVESFVCVQKQAVRRRLSPLSEPVRVIYASVLALIRPEWLSCIGKSAFALARMIAQETQFWPQWSEKNEFGYGMITENGIDMLLTWNMDYYLNLCERNYTPDVCVSGYSSLNTP